MINKKLKILFFIFLAFLSWSMANYVFALEIIYPRVPGAAPPQEFLQTSPPEEHLGLYVLYIFNLAVWIAGAVALGALMYAGVIYLTSAGKPEKLLSARNQIIDAFFGVLLLLSSYLILQVLNPQLTILGVPKLAPIEEIIRPEVAPPPTDIHRSAINTETPFANIIEERIFGKSIMTRATENAATTLEISEKLRDLNEELVDKTYQCSCSQASPGTCGGPCDCDPCSNVRPDMERLQIEILKEVEKLMEEQKKTIELIRYLRQELAKLERAESFMLECKLTPLESLAEISNTENFYLQNQWLFLNIKFWDQIFTIEDWANLYCPVSGTIWGGVQYTPPEEISPVELPEELILEPEACTIEAPVGDIIDRAKRTGYLLVKRWGELLQKSDELIEAKDKELVQVSRCSSQISPTREHMCITICTTQGAYCNAGPPCPYARIEAQLEEIKAIVPEIEKVVRAEQKEKIGIIPIIERVVPKIIEDLNKEVRQPMKQCITELANPDNPDDLPAVLLSNCESSVGSIGPKGIVISNCCLQEPEFQECLQECYLEEGQEKYRQCLEGCLRKKSQELSAAGKTRESEIIATCRNRINFYCCGK